MIGKRDKFWGAVPKNSQRWSWDDVWRQTVPEAASSHRKRCRSAVHFTSCY